MHIYFKIILAFGNYMNGTRKKVAAGFKLESLYKVGAENAWLPFPFFAYITRTVLEYVRKLNIQMSSLLFNHDSVIRLFRCFLFFETPTVTICFDLY